MSNQEIALRLAAAILAPSISLPARRANAETLGDEIPRGAELAVRVYKAVLEAIEADESLRKPA